jgi:signal transduction histidine kinase
MKPRRSNLLLILLVVTPVALLTWLGTYLIRDAARSTSQARSSVLEERLLVADHQLTHDLRQFTDDLDFIENAPSTPAAAIAAKLAEHPWVSESWAVTSTGEVAHVTDKQLVSYSESASAQARSAAIREILQLSGIEQPFASITAQPFALLGSPPVQGLDLNRKSKWLTAVKSDHYHLESDRVPGGNASFPSGWHVSDGDFIYWRKLGGELVCARMNGTALWAAIYPRVIIQGMTTYPGRLALDTATGIPLHQWGLDEKGGAARPSDKKMCSAPLSLWVLSYTPAASEFPEPFLFPILLGVGSGCVLVLALAWTFSRENARELRVAEQRVSFVNQISHELKTPLTNIRLYAEMASHRVEQTGDATTLRHLGVVETETARLDRLIQNVLNYARHQRDKLTVQARPVDIDELVSRVVGNWRPILEGKEYTVESRFQGPGEIKADSDAIEQILHNLLSNVDKYAGFGKWVSIRTETSDGEARIIVEDHGPGIPVAKRHSVFEPFERLRSDLNEGVSGTGIGLTISRELAILHGGSLEVCTQFKEGARFILTLPQPL